MAGFANIHIPPDLAKAVIVGDREAAGRLFQLLSPAVLNVAWRMLGNRSVAEEILQDVFIHVLDSAGSIVHPEALLGWVRTVAINQCLMRLRSPWISRRDSDEPDEVLDTLESDDRMGGISDIEKMLARLQPETRMVVWLHDVEGYTHREIGDLMGKTPSYSKSQLSRGYEYLLTHWQSQNEN
jgi:RNA polymerase sigma factor (sigma-70 family)